MGSTGSRRGKTDAGAVAWAAVADMAENLEVGVGRTAPEYVSSGERLMPVRDMPRPIARCVRRWMLSSSPTAMRVANIDVPP